MVEYLGYVLLHISSPSTTCKVEKEPKPTTDHTLESATWVVPKSRCAAQSIPEIGGDHCLIDLRSAIPFPSRVPTLNSTPSPPVLSGCLDASVPSGDLLLCCRPTSWFHSVPWIRRLHWCVQLLGSLAGFPISSSSPQLYLGPQGSRLHLSPSAPPRLCSPLAPPWSDSH